MSLFNASISTVSKALSSSLTNANVHCAGLGTCAGENGDKARMGWLRHGWMRLQRYQQLRHERRQLWRLSDAMLKDIGLSRADVAREANRPFWDDANWHR